MGIRKQRKRHGGISDAEEESHRLFHLYQSDFPGLSFESRILQPGEGEGVSSVTEKTIIDHRGKVRLDQNDGQPVPLDQIPDVLAGKDADMTDGLHLPNTVAALLTDHNKTLHDTLGIDADMVDGYHHDQSLLTTASPQFANLQCAGTGHDGFSDYVINEHIDWTNTSNNFLTTGNLSVAGNSANFNHGKYNAAVRIQNTAGAAGDPSSRVVFHTKDGNEETLWRTNDYFEFLGDGKQSQIRLYETKVWINAIQKDMDFVVSGNTVVNLFVVDAGNDIIGIRTSTAHGMLSLAAQDTAIMPWMSVRQNNNEAYGFDFDMERASIGRLDFYAVNNEVRTHYLSILRSSGRVGIKTTAPTADLDINSDILRLRTPKTPASSGASGNAGDICWDANYLYICVATNSWRRVAIAGWL